MTDAPPRILIAEALEAARKDRPDLIVLDGMMPGMDGFAEPRALKEDDDTRVHQRMENGRRFAAIDDYLRLAIAPIAWASGPAASCGWGEMTRKGFKRSG